MRIFHTGDLHIGMKFSNYGGFSENLKKARFDVLDNMVACANKEKCDLFVVAGDLFDSLNVTKKQVEQVCKSLAKFEGTLNVVIPGNHDYDDGYNEFWGYFCDVKSDNTVVLNTFTPFCLDEYGFNTVLHSAYCHKKHSKDNNLSKIKRVEGKMNIGIGHGAIDGLSCDMDERYFYMSKDELASCGMDLWLMGHTHVRYPDTDYANDTNIFNAGTPEPDGWNFTRGGNCWVIDIDENGINAKSVSLNTYTFYDISKLVENKIDIEKVINTIKNGDSKNKVVRLTLNGYCDEQFWDTKEEYFEQIRDLCVYIVERYDELKKRVSVDDIKNEFSEGSFPYKLLMNLKDDEESFRVAYDFIKEVL